MPANASPVGTKALTYSPSPILSSLLVPALRPRTRLISFTVSSRTRSFDAPRSASARSAFLTRRASTSAAIAAAGWSMARRLILAERSSSMAYRSASQLTNASKSRNRSLRDCWVAESVFTNSSHRCGHGCGMDEAVGAGSKVCGPRFTGEDE